MRPPRAADRCHGHDPGGSTTLRVTIRVEPNAAGQVTLTTDTPQLKGASNTSFRSA
jgi:hypothetical protein